MMKKLAIVAALGAVTSMAYGAAPSTDPVVVAIDQAREVVEKANTLSFQWRDTAQILRDAEEAFGKGDKETALQLAVQAQHQGENAIKQYERANKPRQ